MVVYPFFDGVIRPILRAAGARSIVEIGALRGETTARLIDDLGPETHLHVIDPLPQFDPECHEATFPGQYTFHRALSLDVLDHLGPVDAALIDGDHNWYTVHGELGALARVARAAGRPLPLCILHDVGWPYDRRDLYYDPTNVPPEGLRPHRRRGINRRDNKLVPEGGFNKTLHHSIEYGTPRTGVMTAVEDFIEEYDQPLVHLHIPVYYGLSILVEASVVSANPVLAEKLRRLDGEEGHRELLHLSEEIRIDAANLEQNFISEYQRRIGVLATGRLELVKRALTGALGLTQELRLDHVRSRRGADPHPLTMIDPVRQMRAEADGLRARNRGGFAPDDSVVGPLTTLGAVGLDTLEAELDELAGDGVGGDYVECGTGRGGAAVFMRAHCDAHFRDGPTIWVCDDFSSARGGGDLNTIRDAFAGFGLLDDRVRFLVGEPVATLTEADLESVALLRLHEVPVELIEPLLVAAYPRLSPDARVTVASFGDPQRVAAVERVRVLLGEDAPLQRPDHHVVSWRRGAAPVAAAPKPEPRRTAPAPAVAMTRRKDLTVVCVFYDMQREAARTLLSLSRHYQQGIDDVDYEVLVIDNGSPEGRGLDRTFVESHGPEFRFIDLAGQATSSPTTALNHGLAEGVGDVFCLMIDGAHILSPGVIRHALVAMAAYEPAVVATQGWYLGPGQQSEVMTSGYDQQAEDRLLAAIDWPGDGYKLFDIAHFQADRDWFDGMWESNCLFVPRPTLVGVGGFDDRFEEAGGGYANLEIFERVCTAPDVNVVSILGEGSFHQSHGGTTNNQPDPAERFGRIERYAKRYEELRGRPFGGPRKPIHYVGTITTSTRRTKARRMAARRYFSAAAPGDPDSPPTTALAIPESLAADYLDAYWRSGAWRHTEWLGEPVRASPDDLFALQGLLAKVRPGCVIDLSRDDRGRVHFLASVLDLLDHGRVVSVAPDDAEPVLHARVTNVTGVPVDAPSVVEEVASLVENRSALVVVGSAARKPAVRSAIAAYGRFVAVDFYLVVEWTAVNGNPIWTGHGPGPTEALKSMRVDQPDFIEDPTVEPGGPSFHRGGFWKRVR